MSIRKKSWRLTAGLATAMLLVPAIPLAGVPGVALPAAFAAENQGKELSKEEAIRRVQNYISIPADFKLERASYQGPERNPFIANAAWSLSWTGKNDAGIYVTLDAATGKLLQYSRYGNETASAGKKVSEEAALDAATNFLEKTVSSDEREKLSEANEYKMASRAYSSTFVHHPFTFTRIENEVPFIGNGFHIVVDEKGEVQQFSRTWYEGSLPAAKPGLTLDEAQEKIAEALPSLVYTRASSITGNYNSDTTYQLVYKYQIGDPQFVDAMTGELLNYTGKPTKKAKLQPLGNTIAKASTDKLITKEEAQVIADQVVKKLPGSYRSDGNRGSGATSGPDGVERRRWGFEYTPVQGQGKEQESFRIYIGDRGELVEYRKDDYRPIRRGEGAGNSDQTVSWEKAEQNAIQFVKALFADRLGEIAYNPEQQSEMNIKQRLEQEGEYTLSFGWLKDSVPVEDSYFRVEVSATTGEVENIRTDAYELEGIQPAKAKIDQEAAKKLEEENQTLTLTYYLPDPYFAYQDEQSSQPLLVYRMVGDAGVVDALSGKWISFEEASKAQGPQDVGDHPQKEALELAVRYGWLTVTDGKLEPDKPLTRGEAAQIMARAMDRMEFHRRSYYSFSDEQIQPYSFDDIDSKHPLYGVIQKNLQEGLIAKEGRRFEPDKPITRAQMADMAARLLGYGDILNKPEIFVPAYPDLQKSQVPAVTLLHAEGVEFVGATAGKFAPEASVTRAEIAQLLKDMLELQQQKQKN